MRIINLLINWKIPAQANWLLPTLARLLFAAILLIYFWKSALTKVGDGIFGFLSPSPGAYAQIFPSASAAVGYDPSQLGIFHWIVAMAGMYAEFILPLLILVGLFARLAALGMIGFVIVQSVVDIFGHGLDDKSIGGWFDRWPDAIIWDQRALWTFLLIVTIVKGAGPVSLDNLLSKRLGFHGK
ncbi:MAG: DoxX family protein [Albidovulum sp.]|nr:DoxX family protein [Albidovulum sp.]MDE0306484.1 DoxX family protein [Albidovulum sp.]MDE0531257.1 DoxX family protein [Albidovulum sp.]